MTGWWVDGATTLENDVEVILTAVSAAQLSLATGGGTLGRRRGRLLSTTRLMRYARLGSLSIPAGAGLATAVAVSGLNTTQMPYLDAEPNRLITLGTDNFLIGQIDAALDTGETLDVTVIGADY